MHLNRQKLSLMLAFVGYCLFANAQSVYLLRHIGGVYLTDPVYQIDLYNPGNQSVNLGGYLLVTRQFVARLPQSVVIPPQQALRLGKGVGPAGMPDLRFEQIPDFLIRIPKSNEGDYLALLNRSGKAIDGFYFGPNRQVGFLPDRDTLITERNQRVAFQIPSETDRIWKYLALRPDPALAFMRLENGWQVGSPNRNLFPATDFAQVKSAYRDGIITIETTLQFEKGGQKILLDRSEDGRDFDSHQVLTLQPGKRDYACYDTDIEAGKRYYYRFRHIDRFGFELRSPITEIRAADTRDDLSLEVFVTGPSESRQINVRLFSPKTADIRLQVLDEQFRACSIRYYDNLNLEGQYLIRIEEKFPPGLYYVLASAEGRRYYTSVMVE